MNVSNVTFNLENIRDIVSSAKWTIMDFIASGDIEESNNLWMPFDAVQRLQKANDIIGSVLTELRNEQKVSTNS